MPDIWQGRRTSATGGGAAQRGYPLREMMGWLRRADQSLERARSAITPLTDRALSIAAPGQEALSLMSAMGRRQTLRNP
jgi:hypothetical protein